MKYLLSPSWNILLCLTFVVLAGCLKESTSTQSASTDGVVDLGFAGVHQVQNMDSSSIKVSWLPATSADVIAYRIYEVSADGTLTAIQQVESTKSAYIHTGLVNGSTHSYLVRAIDKNRNNDGNSIIKSMFTFGGISSAQGTGLTTATVYFNSASGTTGANIYYKPVRGGEWTLAANVSANVTSYVVTGLRSGTTYLFKVHAVDASGLEDTNPITQIAQTSSHSFNPPSPLLQKYKGIILAQAFGTADGAPSGTPQSKQVTIVWNAFNSGSSTSYSLVRVAHGGVLDTTTTTPCTSTMTTSCQVCTISGFDNQKCTDTNVAASPAVYDYVVTMMTAANWPEELPTGVSDASYRVKVHIPPDNMVLVQRDSVNYEQCKLMGRISDPLNYQRCPISGSSMLGAVPYNSGPGRDPLALDPGYYDFGYNLFVDRWTLACNWTPASAGGKCGPGGTAGDCFGRADTNFDENTRDSIGVPGNVFYRTEYGACYYKSAQNTWIQSYDSSMPSAGLAAMATIDPKANGGYRPPIVRIPQSRSYEFCNAQVDANYGPKRLLRRREFVAAAAWPTFTGEPNAMSDSVIKDTEAAWATNPHTSTGGYQCNARSALSFGPFLTTERADDAEGRVGNFIIGSTATKNCMSRFGLQDAVGNVGQWLSDQMNCFSSGICEGKPSLLDSGNGYSAGFDMNGFRFDGVQGAGGDPTLIVILFHQGDFDSLNFNPALGLPLAGTDNGNAFSLPSFRTKLHSDIFWLNIKSDSVRGLKAAGEGYDYEGRWSAKLTPIGDDGSLRCAVPAE